MSIVLNYPAIQQYPDMRKYQLGQDIAGGVSRITDVLLQALLSGQLGRTPTQGSYVSPSGQGTFLSPAERVAANPTVSLSDVLRRQRPVGAEFQPAGMPFRFQPPLTRELQRAQLQQAQAELSNAPLEQRYKAAQAGNLEAQADFYRKYPELLAASQGNAATEPTPMSSSPLEPTSQTETEKVLQAKELIPGQALFESGLRSAGQAARMREVPRGLTQSYKSRTAVAARALGDAANIAVEERKILEASFPQDGDTYEGRVTKERAVTDFLNQKEAELTKVASQQIPQVLKHVSKTGPVFEADPSLTAAKRKAQEGLLAIRQTKVLYSQMYQEAAQKMPPIGSIQVPGAESLSPEESSIVEDLLR